MVWSSALSACPLARGRQHLGPVSSSQVSLAPRPQQEEACWGRGMTLAAQPGELVLSALPTVGTQGPLGRATDTPNQIKETVCISLTRSWLSQYF